MARFRKTALSLGLIAGAMAVTAYAAAPMLGPSLTPQPLLQLASAQTDGEIAENMCSSREQMIGMLSQNFQEAPTALGMIDQEAVVEIFVSEEHGTWTIIASDPNGNSCIISAGEGWQATSPKAVEEQV